MSNFLVTGSSRGIGKAIATLAHSRGHKVIVHGRTDSADLQLTHQELAGSIKCHFDVCNKEDTTSAINKVIADIGPINVLVNNAGGARNFVSSIDEVDDEVAILEYKMNVLGTLHCVQAVIPAMVDSGGGSVINVGSIKGYPNLSTLSTLTYGPAKAGVISLTKSLAKVYPTVRFNCVSPGYVATEQNDVENPLTAERINNGTILGRIAQPDEIAPLVLFLASDEARYITGSDILIDGGYSIKGK